MPESGRDLIPRQERFIEYYVATGNATRSAIKAGYSEKAAPGGRVKTRRCIEMPCFYWTFGTSIYAWLLNSGTTS